MIKQFNMDRSPYAIARPEWPENRTKAHALFSGRRPFRKLTMLVDAVLIDAPSTGDALNKATVLLALLNSEVVEFYRYTDGLPTHIRPSDVLVSPSTYPVYAGWAVVYPFERETNHWPVVYGTNPERSYTEGGVRGSLVDFARRDESSSVDSKLGPGEGARRRELDALALEVARQAVGADVFITERPYLYSGKMLASERGITICTLEDAIPLIALYLRAQGEFLLPTGTSNGGPFYRLTMNRGTYFLVGARELLPEAWRWFSACVQHSSGTGDDELGRLGDSLVTRMTEALQERDRMHIALNQPPSNDNVDEVLSNLTNVLVSLMGAVDVTAGVAHHVLNLHGPITRAAWQRTWRNDVAKAAPALAAVLDSDTQNAHTLTILSLLRNSVHGAALQGVTCILDGKADLRIALPEKSEAKILAAMDATGGRTSWGGHSIAPGLNHMQPAVLVERLFEEVIKLLNDLMRETPVERLSHVRITADTCKPPVDNPSTGLRNPFSERNRSAIRWQLGF